MSLEKLEKNIDKCIYCGEEKEITRDHVVSRNLFPKSYKKTNPVIVPSCIDCNKSFSLDEEYFRQFICGLALEHSQYANNLFFSKIKRSIQRRPQIGYKAWNQMKLVDFYSKGGIYLGKRTAIHISKDDRERHFAVLDKYIKGLFYYEFETVLPEEYKIRHSWGKKELLKNINKWNLKWNLDNEEIFAYGYSVVPNTYTSIWMTVFYDSVFFISHIVTQENLKYFARQKNIQL